MGFGDVSCAVCEHEPARWVRDLDPARSQFRIYGKGHVWGSPVDLCDACDSAVADGDVEALVARDPESRNLTGVDLDEQVRHQHEALVSSAGTRRHLAETRPPGWQELVDAGFVPLTMITGALHLVQGWPDDHRRALPEPDPETASHLPDGHHWFIRSPWPSVELEPLWHLVIHALETADGRRSDRSHVVDRDADARLVADLLASDVDEVQRRIALLRTTRD